MPTIRMQMFFNMTGAGARSAGWSETHYSFTALTLPGALTNLQRLAAVRVNLLGAGVTLRYLRVSDDEVFRDSQTANGIPPLIGPLGPYYLATWLNAQADFGYSAALVRLRGNSDFYTRSLFLSGNPDGVQDINHTGPFGAAWASQFSDFQRELLSGRYGFKVQQVGGAAGPFQIVSLVAGLFTTSAPHGLQVNDSVLISGFRPTTGVPGLNNPNGRWRVAPGAAGTTFGLLGYTQLAFSPSRFGTVKKRIFIVTDYKAVSDATFTKRSRGRPFGLLVGRRRRRVVSS